MTASHWMAGETFKLRIYSQQRPKQQPLLFLFIEHLQLDTTDALDDKLFFVINAFCPETHDRSAGPEAGWVILSCLESARS
jgi:hypothetical protein